MTDTEQTNVPVYKASEKVASMSLEEQLAQDNDDESLRRWKEQMLAGAGTESSDPRKLVVEAVKIVFSESPSVTFDLSTPQKIKEVESRRPALIMPQSETYHLEVSFRVNHDLVNRFCIKQSVHKGIIRISTEQTNIGSFACKDELIVFPLREQAVPQGKLARGNFRSTLTFTDGDDNEYLKFSYRLQIVK